MTDQDLEQDDNARDQAPPGWRYASVSSQRVLMLHTTHPDYPNAIRERVLALDEEEFGNDSAIEAAVARLLGRFANAETILSRPAGDAIPDNLFRAFKDAVEEEAKQLPPSPLTRRRLIYLIRRASAAFPKDLRDVGDSYFAPNSAPFLVVVNASNEPVNWMLYPAGTAIVFDRFATGDLPKLGRIITEAQVLAGQTERPGKGGRPKLPDMSSEAATPEMVAKLRYWEKWSYRRIAAFLGWLRPDESWRDEKIRRRVEQRVRRWVRLGEDDLRRLATSEDWKTRPTSVDLAIAEERPRV